MAMLCPLKAATQQRLYRLSRDTRFLRNAALVIGVAFFGIAAVAAWISSTWTGKTDDFVGREAPIKPAPERYAYRLRNVLDAIDRRGEPVPPKPILDLVDKWGLPSDVKTLFDHYVNVRLHAGDERESHEALLAAAAERPPRRFANGFVADVFLVRNDHARAFNHYQIEISFEDAAYARRQMVMIAVKSGNREKLDKLIADPQFGLHDSQHLIALGVRLKDPALILRGVVMLDYGRFTAAVLPLTLLVGAVWFSIILKICYIPPGFNACVAAGLLGVILGVISTTVTLFFVVVQEQIMGFVTNGEAWNDLVYYVCGVGLREELCKWLLFLPLVPWLYRRRDPKMVIVAASCVGLGFALQENLGYFDAIGTESSFARFITANFLHIALTGVFGYAFCRFLYSPRREWERLLGTFIVVVLAHGLYDYLSLMTGGIIFGIIALALIVSGYLGLVRKHCTVNRQVISPLGLFVIGSACILGLSLTTAAIVVGDVGEGIIRIGPQILSFFPIMFLFIHHFRHE